MSTRNKRRRCDATARPSNTNSNSKPHTQGQQRPNGWLARLPGDMQRLVDGFLTMHESARLACVQRGWRRNESERTLVLSPRTLRHWHDNNSMPIERIPKPTRLVFTVGSIWWSRFTDAWSTPLWERLEHLHLHLGQPAFQGYNLMIDWLTNRERLRSVRVEWSVTTWDGEVNSDALLGALCNRTSLRRLAVRMPITSGFTGDLLRIRWAPTPGTLAYAQPRHLYLHKLEHLDMPVNESVVSSSFWTLLTTALPALQTLRLQGVPQTSRVELSDDVMTGLTRAWPSLTHLKLHFEHAECTMTDDGLRIAVRGWPGMVVARWRVRQVPHVLRLDTLVACLEGWPALEELRLPAHGWGITPLVLAALMRAGSMATLRRLQTGSWIETQLESMHTPQPPTLMSSAETPTWVALLRTYRQLERLPSSSAFVHRMWSRALVDGVTRYGRELRILRDVVLQSPHDVGALLHACTKLHTLDLCIPFLDAKHWAGKPARGGVGGQRGPLLALRRLCLDVRESVVRWTDADFVALVRACPRLESIHIYSHTGRCLLTDDHDDNNNDELGLQGPRRKPAAARTLPLTNLTFRAVYDAMMESATLGTVFFATNAMVLATAAPTDVLGLLRCQWTRSVALDCAFHQWTQPPPSNTSTLALLEHHVQAVPNMHIVHLDKEGCTKEAAPTFGRP